MIKENSKENPELAESLETFEDNRNL